MERAKRSSLILHVISLQIASKTRPLPKISSLSSHFFLSRLFSPAERPPPPPLGASKSRASKQQRTMLLKRKKALEFALSDVTPTAHICYVPCICSESRERRLNWRQKTSSLSTREPASPTTLLMRSLT